MALELLSVRVLQAESKYLKETGVFLPMLFLLNLALTPFAFAAKAKPILIRSCQAVINSSERNIVAPSADAKTSDAQVLAQKVLEILKGPRRDLVFKTPALRVFGETVVFDHETLGLPTSPRHDLRKDFIAGVEHHSVRGYGDSYITLQFHIRGSPKGSLRLASPLSAEVPRLDSMNSLALSGPVDPKTVTTAELMRISDELERQDQLRANPRLAEDPAEDHLVAHALAQMAEVRGGRLPGDALFVASYIAKANRNNREFVEQAEREKSMGLTVANAATHFRTMKLSSRGINRYFRFSPDLKSEHLVPARVLDIYVARKGETYILIEWIDHDDPLSEEARVRHVKTLSPTEALTVTIQEDRERYEIANEFRQTLSSEERDVLAMAQLFNLSPVGYSDPGRVHNQRTRVDKPWDWEEAHFDPMNTSTAKTFDLLYKNRILSRWGSVDDLVRSKSGRMVSGSPITMLQLFSELDPAYVLSRFKSNNTNDVYVWLITEDGKLKICPSGTDIDSTLLALFELGHGRHIYLGGELTFAGPRSVSLKLQSRFFNQAGTGFNDDGTNIFHQLNSPDKIAAFLNFTFSRIAKVNVASVDAQKLNQKFSFSDFGDEPKTENFGYWSDSHTFYQHADQVVRDVHTEVAKELTWGNGKGDEYPLDFEDWLKASGRQGISPRGLGHDKRAYAWALYVMQSTSKDPIDVVKKRKRKLASIFAILAAGHGGYKGEDSPEKAAAQKIVSVAWNIIKSPEPGQRENDN